MSQTSERVHLDMVAVHFSTRCGAACTFCYSADKLAERAIPTSLHTIERILNKLAEEDVAEVLFVGGDPVVHPNFRESLVVARELGLRTTVLSNSWALRPRHKFSEILGLIDSCEATVLGADASTHDGITGRKGSYAQLVQNLQSISQDGREVGICTNAIPENLHQIYDLVRVLVKDYRITIPSLMIQRIIPSGGATGNFKFGLNIADVQTLMEQVEEIVNDFHLSILFEDPVPWCTVDAKYHKYLSRCEWGYTRGSINAEGLLNRCGADDHYRLGSIWNAHIQELWQKHPILNSFRGKRYLPMECQECPLLAKCGGGCPLSCGTLTDHAIDHLYIQKKELESSRPFESTAFGSILDHVTIRYACSEDLNNIVVLERNLFGASTPTFNKEAIVQLFERCPKAFRVALFSGDIVGYSAVFPLSDAGTEFVERHAPQSVIDVPIGLVLPRFAGNSASLYIEVVAAVPSAPIASRVGLLRDLVRVIQSYNVPTYTAPVTGTGLKIARKAGFVRIQDAKQACSELYKRDNRVRTRCECSK